jgi:hypothetical protein
MKAIFSFSEVECMLEPQLQQAQGPSPGLSRYLRAYYVRARDAGHAGALVRADVQIDGAVVVSMDTPRKRQLHRLPLWVLPRLATGTAYKILWKSGRIFFPDERH